MKRQLAIAVLFPIIALLWTIGWLMYSTGQKRYNAENQPLKNQSIRIFTGNFLQQKHKSPSYN
ncbi:hypothetical protein H5T51_09515 [Candidatus Bathyarchaeota archaeon]|nr:hypothetical protein [Candidatus Bathyarchaeota archaeon]